jgi:hypothetical protein
MTRIFQQLLFIIFSVSFAVPVLSQQTEDCTNGLDDDGDGLIDCFDSDCTCTGQCADFYYTTCNADCYYVPPCGQISLGIQWESDANTGTYSPVVAGDMDKDGIPDLVTTAIEGPDLFIIDGATGLTKVHVVAPTVWPGGTAPAIADLDHDGYGEVVIVGFDRILYCYEHDGTLKYTSTIQVGYHPRYRYSVPNIADFDHDGWGEVNIGNQVYNGQTGALLAEGGPGVSAGEHPARVITGLSFASPVAIDALPDSFCPDCDGLEIVAGNQVLSVNLTTGAVTPVVTANAPFTDGFTSVADIDGDGDLDAVVQGRKSTNNFNTVYCWEIETPAILRQFQLFNNWQEGASRVNIADLNGDGRLEISFVSFPRLYALRNNFTVMWTRNVNDASSITCSSIFDFCGDGSADVVYRDQDFLRIINGATGAVSWQDNCHSATHIEAPLILDVDADGQTEVVIQCGKNPNNLSEGTVVAYEAVGTPGISSRSVWNQHAYFNTNINDDLSIPQFQQNHHIIGDSLVLNTFMNQYFNPTFPSPDGGMTFLGVACIGDSLQVTVEVCNLGDNILPPQTPVTAWMGNPVSESASYVGTALIGREVNLGECQIVSLMFPRAVNDTIWLMLNDDGSLAPPYNPDLDFPVTSIGECRFNNNLDKFIYYYNPAPVELGQDTAICDNTTFLLDASGNDLMLWKWSDGSGNPTFATGSPGLYSVTVTDICLIQQLDSIAIEIDSNTVVEIGPTQTMCQGETVSFQESGFDYYLWTSGGAVSCTACASVDAGPPASTFIALEAGFANGCVNRDTAFIIVNDTFNYQIDTVICWGREVVWNNVVIPPDSTVAFYLQTIHGCDSTVVINVIGTTVGTYNIQVDTSVCLGSSLSYLGIDLQAGEEKTYLLSAITGCDSTVLVRVAPRDTFFVEEYPTICYGDTYSIFGTPIGASGNYTGHFTARNGCDSTHVVRLTVRPEIQLSPQTQTACYGESDGSASVSSPNAMPPVQYLWNISGGTDSLVQNLPAGTYRVTVTDGYQCTETTVATVSNWPAYFFTASPDSVNCYGESNGSIGVSSSDPGLLFALDDGPFQAAGTFGGLPASAYVIYAQDIYGCTDTLPVTVSEPPLVTVSLPADTIIELGYSLGVPVTLTGYPPVEWIWSDTSFLSCLACPDPVAMPVRNITYNLTVVDKNGCRATDEMIISVDPVVNVYVPNAMSGGGDNGLFDISYGAAVRRITLLRIYDRWGNMIHEVRNGLPGDRDAVWDGTFRGRAVNPGVYLWSLELELFDGRVWREMGDVTVVR